MPTREQLLLTLNIQGVERLTQIVSVTGTPGGTSSGGRTITNQVRTETVTTSSSRQSFTRAMENYRRRFSWGVDDLGVTSPRTVMNRKIVRFGRSALGLWGGALPGGYFQQGLASSYLWGQFIGGELMGPGAAFLFLQWGFSLVKSMQKQFEDGIKRMVKQQLEKLEEQTRHTMEQFKDFFTDRLDKALKRLDEQLIPFQDRMKFLQSTLEWGG